MEAAAAAAEEGEDDNSSSGSTMVPASAQQSDTSRYDELFNWLRHLSIQVYITYSTRNGLTLIPEVTNNQF